MEQPRRKVRLFRLRGHALLVEPERVVVEGAVGVVDVGVGAVVELVVVVPVVVPEVVVL